MIYQCSVWQAKNFDNVSVGSKVMLKNDFDLDVCLVQIQVCYFVFVCSETLLVASLAINL